MRPQKKMLGGADDGNTMLSMQTFQYIWDFFIKPNISEQIRLLPDSLLIGSFFVALVTQSFPLTIFAITLIEASFIGSGIRRVATMLDLKGTAMIGGKEECFNESTTLEKMMSILSDPQKSAIPSPPMFILATAFSYVISAMADQKDELTALGPAFSSRFYIAGFASFLLLNLVGFYRLAYGCEGIGVLIMSILFGILLGALLMFQNRNLFGREATNVTGIPLLRERTRDGKPIYVCPTSINQQ